MATLSNCSYKFPPNWERVFFFFFCDVKGIFPIETVIFERFLCLDFDASYKQWPFKYNTENIKV